MINIDHLCFRWHRDWICMLPVWLKLSNMTINQTLLNDEINCQSDDFIVILENDAKVVICWKWPNIEHFVLFPGTSFNLYQNQKISFARLRHPEKLKSREQFWNGGFARWLIVMILRGRGGRYYGWYVICMMAEWWQMQLISDRYDSVRQTDRQTFAILELLVWLKMPWMILIESSVHRAAVYSRFIGKCNVCISLQLSLHH